MNRSNFTYSLKRTLKSIKFRAICLCLFFSFVLWSFITFSDFRQHDFEVHILFENSNKPDEIYSTKDSIITVKVNATGFDFLFRGGFDSHKEAIRFDVNNFPINKEKGEIKISTDLLKKTIVEFVNVEDFSVSLFPDTVHLTWQKKYSKTIPVVCKTNFECRNSYRLKQEPLLLIEQIKVEGERSFIDKIDTLFTKNITLSNIDRSNISLIPLEIKQQYQSLYFQTTNIPIKIEVEEVTENVVELPVNIVQNNIDENIKIFPLKVKVKYRLPIKEFKNINPESFYMYVVCDEDLHNKKKLRVKYSNIPLGVEILEINPARIDYIILNE